MKKVKFILPVLAFLFAIAAAFATNVNNANQKALVLTYHTAGMDCPTCTTPWTGGTACSFSGEFVCKCTNESGPTLIGQDTGVTGCDDVLKYDTQQ